MRPNDALKKQYCHAWKLMNLTIEFLKKKIKNYLIYL